ncbi:MAG: N-acetylmuramoyl-L-alanine amidase [Cyclobacteriaceae bacterium]|jgi:N-acetylmuramoyl-L-alanine amidase
MRGLVTAANMGRLRSQSLWCRPRLRVLPCLLSVVLATVLCAVLLIAPASQALASPVTIESVRVRPSPERTRIVFDLSAPVEHKVFTLTNPRRLVIDIDDVNLKRAFDDLDLQGTPIGAMRAAKRNDNDLRVVLDLSDQVKPRSFVLRPILQYGDRLVVDLYTADQQVAPIVQKSDRVARQMREVVIAVDAGHGGDDPGAIGPGKLYEKDVVLAIAAKLAQMFNAEPGFKAAMTREGDYYVAHRKRTDIARQAEADVFLSIHADAFKTSQARGASVYAISQKGATSETARWLAEKENRADLIGGVGLDDKDDLLAGVLLDLTMTHSLAASLDMGQSILKYIKPVNHLHKKQVEQAAFLVLKSPDIPSLLVETGFISNPAEAAKLRTRPHQERMARAIFSGVKTYLSAHPPAGSFLAWKGQGDREAMATYTIVRGDTLSGIASRHRVTAKQLKVFNGLLSDRIKIGQLLKIPTS